MATKEQLARFVSASQSLKQVEENTAGEIGMASAKSKQMKQLAEEALLRQNTTCALLPDGRYVRMSKYTSSKVPKDEYSVEAAKEIDTETVMTYIAQLKEKAAKKRKRNKEEAEPGAPQQQDFEKDAIVELALDALRPFIFPTNEAIKVMTSCERGVPKDLEANPTLVAAVSEMEAASAREKTLRSESKAKMQKHQQIVDELQLPLLHWQREFKGVPRLRCTIRGKPVSFAVKESTTTSTPSVSVGLVRGRLAELLENCTEERLDKKISHFKKLLKEKFASNIKEYIKEQKVVGSCIKVSKCKA